MLDFDFSFKTAAVSSGGPTPPPNGNPSPPPEEAACGGGCAFLIIFFVGGALYVAGTVAFYYIRQGKRGSELVPHKEFWTDIPFLVKDGVVFLFTKIKDLVTGGGTSAGQATYQQI